jgi:hypothetical protein
MNEEKGQLLTVTQLIPVLSYSAREMILYGEAMLYQSLARHTRVRDEPKEGASSQDQGPMTYIT